jgi:exportin-7
MDPNQLSQVETLCAQLYAGQSDVLRNEAQQQLLVLQTSIDYIPQCQYILDNSKQAYAQVMAASSLEILVSQFWTNFSVDQKIELKNYVLNLLAANVPTLAYYVVGSITKLLCRITKLGWFDSPVHREIINDVTKFLEATVAHNIIGLKILNSLVEEMNSPSTNSTVILHRKTAVSFRDQCLFQTFQIAITSIRQLEEQQTANRTVSTPGSDIDKMETLALQLAAACLQFDFMGTNPEESAEDVGTVQVPTTWVSIVQDTSILQMLFRCYSINPPPRSSVALICLMQLTSLRRSLFPSERERSDYLVTLMTGIHNILKNNVGLQHDENYHEFCRLLSRLKSAYQLSEMIRSPVFNDVIELTSAFTIQSFANWSMAMNSIHYLLAFWGRMVAALPFLRTDTADSQRQLNMLRMCVLKVTESYVTSALGSVDAVHDGMCEDPMADEGSFKEQMDKLPLLIHLQYEAMTNFISQLFEQVFMVYQQLMAGNGTASRKQIAVAEDQLAWLVQMIAAVIGNPQTSLNTNAYDAVLKSNQVELLCDGRLCRYIFQLVQMIEIRTRNSQGQLRCNVNLEMAVLAFFRAYKKSYLIDAATGLPVSSGGAGLNCFLSLLQ